MHCEQRGRKQFTLLKNTAPYDDRSHHSKAGNSELKSDRVTEGWLVQCTELVKTIELF